MRKTPYRGRERPVPVTDAVRLKSNRTDGALDAGLADRTVICRSGLHATLERKHQLMPTLKLLRTLTNRIPDKCEHLVR
jgi:hypothetical protein